MSCVSCRERCRRRVFIHTISTANNGELPEHQFRLGFGGLTRNPFTGLRPF